MKMLRQLLSPLAVGVVCAGIGCGSDARPAAPTRGEPVFARPTPDPDRADPPVPGVTEPDREPAGPSTPMDTPADRPPERDDAGGAPSPGPSPGGDGDGDGDAPGDGDGDGDAPGDGDGDGDAPAGTPRLPPGGVDFDYQIGGAYPPPEGVGMVSRDRHAEPAPGVYNICYVNGFQTQPGEEDRWEPDLLLRDASGEPVIDPDWNELLLDITSDDKRARVAAQVGAFIEGCAEAGYDAVEIDNLDTYSRSGGRIEMDDAVAFMRALSDIAHGRGLAIAQKNAAELLGRRAEMGTDFSVAEECARWDECDDYIDAYGPGVLMIEYRQRDFDAACAAHGETHPIVLRDLDVVPAGRSGYVHDDC